VLATPPQVTAALLCQAAASEPQPRPEGKGINLSQIAALLPTQSSSAIIVALAFAPEQAARLRIPRGFGYVVPTQAPLSQESEQQHNLLACTFVDQKFPGRVPDGAILLRAFFGGHAGQALQSETDDSIVEQARRQLARVLGPLPSAVETVVRRWPLSLPQYEVGHLDRMQQLETFVSAHPGLHLVGCAYYGVGLPDLIRQGRAVARLLASSAAQRTTV
jgi:protoporphyrinogen/coproporphyrinogen III oxidase